MRMCLPKHYGMRMGGGVDAHIRVFVTLALIGGEWSTFLPLYPRGKRLGGLQSRSGRYGEVKILDHTGTRTLTSRLSSPLPIAIPTALPRLILSRDQLLLKRNSTYMLTNLNSTTFGTGPCYHEFWRWGSHHYISRNADRYTLLTTRQPTDLIKG
jgi:hypothetical protein